MVEPTYENILKLRKDDLKALGKYVKVELKSTSLVVITAVYKT